jgi:hypothetical protein
MGPNLAGQSRGARMRLAKHTQEEIDEAKKQSGDATPTPEQLAEWERVHQSLNRELSFSMQDNGVSTAITNIDNVVIPHLGDAGQRIARCRGRSTVMEVLKNNKTDKVFPWHKSELTGYEHITEEAIDGLDCNREFVLTVFLTKMITVDKGSNIEYWIKRFAAMFNRLAYYDKINYGILSSFIALPLGDLDAEREVNQAVKNGVLDAKELSKIRKKWTDKAKTMRILLMVYPYSHYEKEELNEWLGNEAFVEEGGLGNDDWSGLPDV